MWKRIVYAEWTDIVPYLAFFLTFGVFLILAVRALMMRKRHAKRMSRLPLEDEPPKKDDRESSDENRKPNHSN